MMMMMMIDDNLFFVLLQDDDESTRRVVWVWGRLEIRFEFLFSLHRECVWLSTRNWRPNSIMVAFGMKRRSACGFCDVKQDLISDKYPGFNRIL